MKRILIAYTSFSRLERLGLAALSILLLLLIITWQTMSWWLPQEPENKMEQQQLAAAYRDFYNQYAGKETADEAAEETDATVLLFPFDPNTLDSIGFRKLGMNARAVKGLMNWRRHGKKFYKKEDLQPLYNLSAEEYARLEPYITISTITRETGRGYNNTYIKLPPLPATLDLNTIDSAMLVRLNGIGPTLAHKIIERRKLLGGYLRHEQLLEVYKFSDSTLTMLRQRIAGASLHW
jgi:competence protein ComEA